MRAEGDHTGMAVHVRPFEQEGRYVQAFGEAYTYTTKMKRRYVKRSATWRYRKGKISLYWPLYQGRSKYSSAANGDLESMIRDAAQKDFKVVEMHFQEDGIYTIGNLHFAKMTTTKNHVAVSLNVSKHALGTIRVELEAGEEGTQFQRCPYFECNSPEGPGIGEVDAISAKRYGSQVLPTKVKKASRAAKHRIWTPLRDDALTHHFIFHYRTKPVLEYLNILRVPTTIQTDLEQAVQVSSKAVGGAVRPSKDLKKIRKKITKTLRRLTSLKRKLENKQLADIENNINQQQNDEPRSPAEVIEISDDGE